MQRELTLRVFEEEGFIDKETLDKALEVNEALYFIVAADLFKHQVDKIHDLALFFGIDDEELHRKLTEED